MHSYYLVFLLCFDTLPFLNLGDSFGLQSFIRLRLLYRYRIQPDCLVPRLPDFDTATAYSFSNTTQAPKDTTLATLPRPEKTFPYRPPTTYYSLARNFTQSKE